MLIDDLLANVGPGNIPVFMAYRTIELVDLTSNVYQFDTIRFKSALTIRTVKAIDLLNSNIYYVHQSLALLNSQKKRR